MSIQAVEVGSTTSGSTAVFGVLPVPAATTQGSVERTVARLPKLVLRPSHSSPQVEVRSIAETRTIYTKTSSQWSFLSTVSRVLAMWYHYWQLTSGARNALTSIHTLDMKVPPDILRAARVDMSSDQWKLISPFKDTLNLIDPKEPFFLNPNNLLAIECVLGEEGAIKLIWNTIKENPQFRGRGYALIYNLLRAELYEGNDAITKDMAITEEDFYLNIRALAKKIEGRGEHVDAYSSLFDLVIHDVQREYNKLLAKNDISFPAHAVVTGLSALGYSEVLTLEAWAGGLQHTLQTTVNGRGWNSYLYIAEIFSFFVDAIVSKGMRIEGALFSRIRLVGEMVSTPLLFLDKYLTGTSEARVRGVLLLELTPIRTECRGKIDERLLRKLTYDISAEVDGEPRQETNEKNVQGLLKAAGVPSVELNARATLFLQEVQKKCSEIIPMRSVARDICSKNLVTKENKIDETLLWQMVYGIDAEIERELQSSPNQIIFRTLLQATGVPQDELEGRLEQLLSAFRAHILLLIQYRLTVARHDFENSGRISQFVSALDQYRKNFDLTENLMKESLKIACDTDIETSLVKEQCMAKMKEKTFDIQLAERTYQEALQRYKQKSGATRFFALDGECSCDESFKTYSRMLSRLLGSNENCDSFLQS